ncbi:hypothetical protein RWE15_02615 [Virgibacillus halophilus]|uniref:Amidohydrolase family protein n=1 Tax=Tigheibacillus halophilus TaxID=361280 RepID=A0ABU5C2J4_9BACI|nr:hypothetical protein [Virgibacillus halophilus]
MTEIDTVLKGNIVLKDKVVKGAVSISEGKIIHIHEDTEDIQSNEIKDYGDAYIFPGLIDVHVHCFSNPNEGFVTTSSSAAAGGGLRRSLTCLMIFQIQLIIWNNSKGK